MAQPTTRVVLAEDNEIIRRGIRVLLEKSPDIQVIGEASNGIEAVRLSSELQPDILLLDVELPFMNGIEVARQLGLKDKKPLILVLSTYDDWEYIRNMLANGVSGYLVKDEAPERIIEAVQGIARGDTGWVSPRIAKKLGLSSE